MGKFIRSALAATALATVLAANAKAADPIADWNQIAEQAVKDAHHPPPVASLDFAIVHLAIYDAVESFDHRFEPYNALVPGAAGSPSAAVAKAGRDMLMWLFPMQSMTLQVAYENYLTTNGIDAADPGTAVGTQAAANMIARRANDGRFPSPSPPPFLGGSGIGEWRPTPSLIPGPPPTFAPVPPSGAPGLTPWVATVTPFTMQSGSQFRLGPPPDLASDQWAEDYNEVKSLGSLNSTTRTPEQTDMGYFWADSGPILWQNALRYLARNYLRDIGDSARMYALAEAAMADAQIACWDSKYFYVFWRPITAVRLGDQDGNPATVGDPAWQPLINTPNFPEYPSGHADISSAATNVLRLFFGSNVLAFQMTTTNPLAVQKTRAFARFTQAEQEVVDARVYVGIHYRNSDNAARAQGHAVANWVFRNYFLPVDLTEESE